ncbi:MAG: DUF859 domain-containing protein [Lachnospiraceae bacterium]|nr:DUF859 domain-containing protein [Lachnospiraceae bacterium]
MSLTKRTYTDILGNTLVSTGSVTGATTKLTMVFTANNTLWGVQSTINVYVDGTKVTCTWTTNKTETWMGTTYKTKLTSQQLTINKPFFNLKLVNATSGSEIYNDEFSFYEIEKTPTAATTSGGVMDGSTKSRVVFTTSGTDATYAATFTLGSYSGTATSTTKTLEYAIPIAWCNALPNAATGQANVTCQVKYGGVVYSSFGVILTVSVPTSIVPTVTSITLADKTSTPVPSAWNMFIQHKSGVRVSAITTAGAYSSTISKIKLQVGTQSISQNYSASSLPQIDVITQSGSLTCTVTVTDSRGRTASKTATVTFVPYAAPKFTNCVSERCLANGEVDNDGTYFKSTTAVSFSTCNGNNTITLTVKYKRTDAVVYGSETTITPGVNTCGNNDLDTEFSYDVMYSVTDQFCTVTFTDYISTAIYLMHFLHGGKGVAFGQKATTENYLDCAFKALFRDDVYFVTGNGVQVNIRDIITIGAQTLTSFGDGLFLCAQDGKLIAQVPSIGIGTPTTLTNGQFLYANNGNIGSRTIALSNTTDGVYKAGDTVQTGGIVWGYGALTSNSADMYLVVPLGKLITASSATITTGTMTVRTIAGYAFNKAQASGGTYSGLDITQYSPTVSLNKPSGTIRIKVTNSTKWVNNAGTVITNNTPVTAALSITVKFA